MGHKKLLPKEALAKLALVESRAHALVEANTFPFLNGVSRYLPNAKLQAVSRERDELEDEFNECRQAVKGLAGDHERMLAVIANAFPKSDIIDRKFSFHTQTFQLALPDAIPMAKLVEMETQRGVVEARRQAAADARREIERSCQEFIADCVATLREQTAGLCNEMLETIRGTGSVHQKTLNRLLKFIDHFRELNFVNDAEMAEKLENVRREFLTRTAQDYRDSNTARRNLANGLQGLRAQAMAMASESNSAVIQTFGQVGQRKFQLAA